MPERNSLVNVGLIIFLLLIVFSSLFFLIKPTADFLPLVSLFIPIIFIIAFINTDFALLILIFSMLLSPEISLGGAGGRSVVIRFDDIFLLVVFFGWATKVAINKELGFFRVTPLNKTILIYCFTYTVATLVGILSGVISFKIGFFYLFKYFEYFLLYFMVVNSLHSKRQIKAFVKCMLFVTLIISIYAWIQHFSGVGRVTAPFEGVSGEPNTLGGYLVIMLMVATGLLLNITVVKEKILLAITICAAFPALLFTLSRGSWISFLPAFITLMFLSRKGKLTLFMVALLFIVLFSSIFPSFVYKRVQYTFAHQTERSFLGKKIMMDKSAAARFDSWTKGFEAWSKAPILGQGASSAGAVTDNQYTRVLVETGILGTFAFLLLILAMFKHSRSILRNLGPDEHFEHGLTVGFIAALMGLLFHSFSAATFILIRIMEPFWFLTALVIAGNSIDITNEEVLEVK